MIEITILRCGPYVLVRIAEAGESVSLLIPRPKRRDPDRPEPATWPKSSAARTPTTAGTDDPWIEWLRKLQGGR